MEITKPTTLTAYYMVPKNGGFQLRIITVEEGIVLDDQPVSDPDAWDQVISVLEQQLSRKFQ